MKFATKFIYNRPPHL